MTCLYLEFAATCGSGAVTRSRRCVCHNALFVCFSVGRDAAEKRGPAEEQRRVSGERLGDVFDQGQEGQICRSSIDILFRSDV